MSDPTNTQQLDNKDDDTAHKNHHQPSSSIWRKKLQAFSALPFAAYVALHLGVHATYHFGSDKHRAVFLWARKFYNDSPILEAGLLGSAFVHAVVSLGEGWKRSPQEWTSMIKNDPARTIHISMGYILAFIIPIHTYFGRVENVRSGINDPEFGTFATAFFPELFVPYYITLSVAGLVHAVLGLVKASRILKLPVQLSTRSMVFKGALALGCVVVASSVLAMAGFYFPIKHIKAMAIIEHNRHAYPSHQLYDWLVKRYMAKF